ncbi:MAG: SCO family protein [Gemmatimonadales bacterium]|nr:SCO family protein [Gemmatimonadales bacterium]
MNRSDARASVLPLVALALIGVITAGWWALALWPVANEPGWLATTRAACFGTRDDGLPSAGGWVLLIGEPIGMLGVLVAVWGRSVREGLRQALGGWVGRVSLAAAALLLVTGVAAATMRVRSAGSAEPFAANEFGSVAPVDRPAPELALVDQAGQPIRLTDFGGRPVLVTFAFAHCTTVCPAQVQGVLTARRRAAADDAADEAPVSLIVTVDPWRDTPSRLPAIATGWKLEANEHVLSGPVADVQATLAAWRIRTERDTLTGDVGHPATVYLIGRDGRIRGLGLGTGRDLAAAVDRL